MGEFRRQYLTLQAFNAAAARDQAADLARRISAHHREHQPCTGPLRATRRGVARQRCEVERALFAQLDAAREAGWPSSS